MAATIEEEVQRAAIAVIQPTTDPATRRHASKFLEEFTRKTESLDVYVKWLTSFRQQEQSIASGATVNIHEYRIPMQMLCLTMLQSKLRQVLLQRSDGHTTNPNLRGIAAIRTELWEYLRQQPSLDRTLVGPCCICNAIVIVRSEGALAEFIANAGQNLLGLPQEIVLRLMSCLPAEMEARQDLTASQVREGLQFHIEAALDTIRKSLITNENRPSVVLAAYQALQIWIEISHASLTQINTPTYGGPHAILPAVIQLLSSSSNSGNDAYDELTLQSAARALMAAIMVISDSGTTTRQSAAAQIWQAIPQGFIVHPLQIATMNEWHDATHALSSLLSTFVVEHIDDIVINPAGMGLQVLLEIQLHPSTSVALIPLECWLTIQEIPTGERHEHWKQPLYKNLVEILLRRVAYPPQFTSWENELEIVEQSDFLEFRRMATDVLVSCYFLLRYEMVQMLTQHVRAATDWRASEAALFVLAQISKDVCARCRSHAADGTLIARDRHATQQELLQLLEQLITVDSCVTNSQHKYLLGSVLGFCGNYSPAWIVCPPQAILQLLVYLQSAFGKMPVESGKATRAIYVSCLAKNMPNLEDIYSSRREGENSVLPMILKSVRTSMEAVLLTSDEEAMTTVAEGATRVVTKLVNPEVARQAMTTQLIQPVLNHIYAALKALPESNNAGEWMSPTVQSAIESLSRFLSVIRIISRFCDAPHIPAMGEWLLHQIDPCLQLVQQRTASTLAQSFILPKWVAIQQQILRSTLPQQGTMITIFTNTIPLIVQALEQTNDPCTLKYISTAVETFGGQTLEMDKSFIDLLAHVTAEVTSKGDLSEAMEFLQAYFECLQRYILYCPRALCYNPQLLSNILKIAVESISVIEAKESTRAALIFLSQLLGWKSLRLSPQSSQILAEAWNSSILKEMIMMYGPTITQSCVTGLTGGPQMLMAAYSDTLFSLCQSIAMNEKEELGTPTNPANNISSQLNENLIRNWLFSSMVNSNITNNVDTDISNQIIAILLTLARDDFKSRPKAKAKAKMLLTDYAKIRKGEIESLISYQLP
jgi:hypothetical protein